MDEPPKADEAPDETFDPTHRKLCPDGACVGVLGDDGVCRVCGRTEAQAAAGEEAPGAASSDFDAGGDLVSGDAPTGDPAAGDSAAGGFDPHRRLCDDGSCVGVVGADGVCAVCGRRAE
ncbi:MAG TPA: hypothetical protein VLA14_09755 [Polyangia bacterium]|jgi:hypothetical protein|nr:hypothetical protein [Polyangia bacterium]